MKEISYNTVIFIWNVFIKHMHNNNNNNKNSAYENVS